MGFDDSGRLVLTQGWRTFARAQKLTQDQILHFRFNGEDTLFVTVFGYLGGRVECCLEGSSEEDGSEEGGSSSSEEEEDEGNPSRVKLEWTSSSRQLVYLTVL